MTRLRLVSRRRLEPAGSGKSRAERAVEFAWDVHGAQESWTEKADLKASILLALEGGGLYAMVTALASGGVLANVAGWPRQLAEIAGFVSLLVAVVAAGAVIFPRLGRAGEHRDFRHHAIYFGTLRHWDATRLRDHLAGMSPEDQLEALSWQLSEMAKLNWIKHRWIQVSLTFSMTGIAAFVIAAATL
jgi:Pycsar effector protein